eukprot:6476391-Amphidinium_carterae.1
MREFSSLLTCMLFARLSAIERLLGCYVHTKVIAAKLLSAVSKDPVSLSAELSRLSFIELHFDHTDFCGIAQGLAG